MEAKRAVELDPLSALICSALSWFFTLAGRFEDALKIAQDILEFDPNNFYGKYSLAIAYARMGLHEEAIFAFKGLEYFYYTPGYLGSLYSKTGRKDEAQKLLTELLHRWEKGYFPPYVIAAVYSGLAEKEKTFEWLDRAYENRDVNQYYFKVDPLFAELHSDPRWKEQMKKRGLAD